jgi:hypothetical protein
MCSRHIQRWKHKKIYELLNVGHGGMQVWRDLHTSRQIDLEEAFEGEGQVFARTKRFFKLFRGFDVQRRSHCGIE